MNKVITGLFAFLAVGSASWAMYERVEEEAAIEQCEVSESLLVDLKRSVLKQEAIANELRQEYDKAMARAEEATAKWEACVNRRK